MIAIVFFVLLYRLAVAGLIFRALNGLPLGPSVGDIIVSITGAAIQLIAIIIMNKIYEFLAYRLTKWGKCLTYVCGRILSTYVLYVCAWQHVLNDPFSLGTMLNA